MYRINDNQAAPSRRNRKGAMVLWGVLVAAGSCAPAISTAGAETRADARNLTQGQIAVYSTQVPMAVAPAAGAERLSVVAWVDQADRTYAVGEHVRLFVRANKEAYLAVLNVGATGQTTVLFPNAYQPQIRVAAHEVAEIPPPGSGANIRVSGPTGRELIRVIASTQPIPASAGGVEAGPFGSVETNPHAPGRDMQATVNGGAAVREWADHSTVITTVGSPAGAMAPLVPVPLVPMPPVPMHQGTGPLGTVPQGMAPQGTAWPPTDFGLRVATDKPIYRIGEPVSVYASAAVPCYLTLYNVGSSGQVRVLVPNAAQPQILVPAGRTVVFPMAGSNLRLSPMGPPGKETVVAVCGADNRPVVPHGQSGLAASRDLAVAAAGSSANRPVDRATVEFMVTL